ncbi:MAG: hypothetical protein Q8L55_09655 [Phycisphaerales bacterium]|nr:hypothetical protein [Phycisphaerales bacterium]
MTNTHPPEKPHSTPAQRAGKISMVKQRSKIATFLALGLVLFVILAFLLVIAWLIFH